MRAVLAPVLSKLEAKTQSIAWGIFFMVSGTMIVPVMDAIAKLLGGTLSPLQITWGRFLFQALIMSIAIVLLYGPALLMPKRPLVHLIRGLLLAIATTFFFFSLIDLPLADAIAIFFVQPMVLTIMSALFLGETIGWHRRIAVIAVCERYWSNCFYNPGANSRYRRPEFFLGMAVPGRATMDLPNDNRLYCSVRTSTCRHRRKPCPNLSARAVWLRRDHRRYFAGLVYFFRLAGFFGLDRNCSDCVQWFIRIYQGAALG